MTNRTLTEAEKAALYSALPLSPLYGVESHSEDFADGLADFVWRAIESAPSMILNSPAFSRALALRCAELSDPEDKPWPCVRFDSVPTGKAGMDVPVWSILARLAGDGDEKASPRPSLDEIVRDLCAWQRDTFPHGNPASVSAHLYDEVCELVADPTDPNEIADCFILIAGVADRAGVDLVDAVQRKMAINRARKWGIADERGVIRHLPTAPTEGREADG